MVDQALVKEVLGSKWHVVEGWNYCFIESKGGSPFIRLASDAIEIARAVTKAHNEILDRSNRKLLIEA